MLEIYDIVVANRKRFVLEQEQRSPNVNTYRLAVILLGKLKTNKRRLRLPLKQDGSPNLVLVESHATLKIATTTA
jgi:hypothetical protein